MSLAYTFRVFDGPLPEGVASESEPPCGARPAGYSVYDDGDSVQYNEICRHVIDFEFGGCPCVGAALTTDVTMCPRHKTGD